MDLQEALRLLQLSGTVDAQAARRSYLKLIKRHKPEQDPEGFARVRTAWETVDQALQCGISPRAAEHPTRRDARTETIQQPAALDHEAARDWASSGTPTWPLSAEPHSPSVPSTPELDDDSLGGSDAGEHHRPRDHATEEQEEEEEEQEVHLVDVWLDCLDTCDEEQLGPAFEQALEFALSRPLHAELPAEAVVESLCRIAASGKDDELLDRTLQLAARWRSALGGSQLLRAGTGSEMRYALLNDLRLVKPHIAGVTYQLLAQLLATEDEAVRDRFYVRRTHHKNDYRYLKTAAPRLAELLGAPERTKATSSKGRPSPWLVLLGASMLIRLIMVTVDARNHPHVNSYQTSRQHVDELLRVARQRALPPSGPVPATSAAATRRIAAGRADRDRVDRSAARLETLFSELGYAVANQPLQTAVVELYAGECAAAGPALAELDVGTEGFDIEVRMELKFLWAEFAAACPGMLSRFQPTTP